jgi:hypothetical protein
VSNWIEKSFGSVLPESTSANFWVGLLFAAAVRGIVIRPPTATIVSHLAATSLAKFGA